MGPYDYYNAPGWPMPNVPPGFNPNYGWQAPQQARPQNAPPATNVELVTSLNEALIRSSARNSDMFYLDQNRPVFYRVRVSADGVKSYLELPYILPDQVENAPATKADVQMILERLAALEASRAPAAAGKKKKVEEVIDCGESNG